MTMDKLLALAEAAMLHSDNFHKSMIRFEDEMLKLRMVLPREMQYALRNLRFAVNDVRREVQHLQGREAPVAADPNGEARFEISRED